MARVIVRRIRKIRRRVSRRGGRLQMRLKRAAGRR